MKSYLAAAAGLAILLMMGTASAADEGVTSAIGRVVVFPSGAEVERTAKVAVPAGETALVFADLPAETVPGSVRIEAAAGRPLSIGSVNQRRLYVPQSGEGDGSQRQQVEADLEAAKDARDLIDVRIAAAEAQQTFLNNLANLPHVAPAPGGDGGAQTDWTRILGLIGVGTNEVRKTMHEARIERRDLDEKIADLEKKLEELAPKSVERTEVKVFVTSDAATEADVTLRYQVRSASWQPTYEARLDTAAGDGKAKLDLVRRAAITQRTGEDWSGVELRLSTTRPTAGSSAPDLRPVFVDIAKPTPPAAKLQGKTGNRVAIGAKRSRDESMAAADAAPQPAPMMLAAEPAMARIEAAPFQAVYGVPGRTDVTATGEEKTVVITRDALDAALKIKAVPKREAKAYLYAAFTYAGETPLLPGTVALFRDGSFVGNGRLPLIAGKEHELGFGADDAVKVEHAVVGEKRGETGLISTTRTDDRHYKMTITNLHKQAVEVSVLDQMPVSRDEKITVSLTAKTAPTKKNVDDKQGLLAWEFPLDAGAEKVIDFGYVVKWPADEKISYR